MPNTMPAGGADDKCRLRHWRECKMWTRLVGDICMSVPRGVIVLSQGPQIYEPLGLGVLANTALRPPNFAIHEERPGL